MRKIWLFLILFPGGIGPPSRGAEEGNFSTQPTNADIVVVGAGIAGLAAALDAGRAGANVTVIDTWSVFGGHAVMSQGLVCLVDTPFKRARGIADSPDLAIGDFLTHGRDANPDWVRLYARESKGEVYDWLGHSVYVGSAFSRALMETAFSVNTNRMGAAWDWSVPSMWNASVGRTSTSSGTRR